MLINGSQGPTTTLLLSIQWETIFIEAEWAYSDELNSHSILRKFGVIQNFLFQFASIWNFSETAEKDCKNVLQCDINKQMLCIGRDPTHLRLKNIWLDFWPWPQRYMMSSTLTQQ